jgi:NADH-quinone oxidoreductase subunit J
MSIFAAIAAALPAIAFWVLAAVLVASAAMVVCARNPVHAVLFLILTFFNAAGLFLLAGAEFLAMILVIVYVGAVAVLFLFVVMMLDIDFTRLREGFQRYAPVGAAVGVLLLIELGVVLSGWHVAAGAPGLRAAPIAATLTNTTQLGTLLYTHYVLLFQAAGLILLVAMIGAIVLTHREGTASRRQSIAQQVARDPATTLVLMDVAIGAGASEFLRREPEAVEAEPAHEPAHHGGH